MHKSFSARGKVKRKKKARNRFEDQLVNNHDNETIDPLSLVKNVGD